MPRKQTTDQQVIEEARPRPRNLQRDVSHVADEERARALQNDPGTVRGDWHSGDRPHRETPVQGD